VYQTKDPYEGLPEQTKKVVNLLAVMMLVFSVEAIVICMYNHIRDLKKGERGQHPAGTTAQDL